MPRVGAYVDDGDGAPARMPEIEQACGGQGDKENR
jgi:hypothetical protein